MSKRSFQSPILLLLIFSFALVLQGCSVFNPAKPNATAANTSTPRPPRKTRTPSLMPSFTATTTGTPTVTATATLPPPPDDFTQARLYSSGPGPDWDFFFNVDLKESIKGDYEARVGDPAKRFECRPLTEYAHPERLHCTGRIPEVDKNLVFTVIEKKTGQVVYKGYVFSPLP